jgi:hypothetical protein
MVLERLSPVDEDHRNFLVKLGVRGTIVENIYFPKFESLRRTKFAKLRFDLVAQTASGLGVENDFNHWRLKGF